MLILVLHSCYVCVTFEPRANFHNTLLYFCGKLTVHMYTCSEEPENEAILFVFFAMVACTKINILMFQAGATHTNASDKSIVLLRWMAPPPNQQSPNVTFWSVPELLIFL